MYNMRCKEWSNKWNLAIMVSKDDTSDRAKKLLDMGDFVLDVGDCYVVFRKKVRKVGKAFQVKVPQTLQQKIKQKAKQEGKSLNDFVCKVLEEYDGVPNIDYYRGQKEEPMDKSLTVYLPAELRSKVERIAQKLEVSLSEVIRRILEERVGS